MSNIIPLPVTNIDAQLSEAFALLEMLISVGENAEDDEFLRLRPSLTSTLYVLTDKLKAADKSLPALYRRGKAS